MLVRRKFACKTSAGSSKIIRWTQKWGQPSENFAAACTCCASRFATLQLEHECQLIPFSLCASQVRFLLYCQGRSKAYRGLPEARGQSEAHGDSNLHNTIVGVPWQLMVRQWDTVVPSGLAKVLLFAKGAPVLAKKRSLQNLILGAVKHWPWTPRSGPPSCVEKLMVKTISNFASCEDLFL